MSTLTSQMMAAAKNVVGILNCYASGMANDIKSFFHLI